METIKEKYGERRTDGDSSSVQHYRGHANATGRSVVPGTHRSLNKDHSQGRQISGDNGDAGVKHGNFNVAIALQASVE